MICRKVKSSNKLKQARERGIVPLIPKRSTALGPADYTFETKHFTSRYHAKFGRFSRREITRDTGSQLGDQPTADKSFVFAHDSCRDRSVIGSAADWMRHWASQRVNTAARPLYGRSREEIQPISASFQADFGRHEGVKA